MDADPPSCSSSALMRSAGFSYSIRSTLPELGLEGSWTASSDCSEQNDKVCMRLMPLNICSHTSSYRVLMTIVRYLDVYLWGNQHFSSCNHLHFSHTLPSDPHHQSYIDSLFSLRINNMIDRCLVLTKHKNMDKGDKK